MLWCQGAQNFGLFNHKLKCTLKCTVWSQCTPVPDRQTDGQTNEHHGHSATIRYNERIARYNYSDSSWVKEFLILFLWPVRLHQYVATMGLHGQTSSIFFCLLHIPLPVVHRFLFDADPLWHCLYIFSSVFPGFLYLTLMSQLLSLVIWSGVIHPLHMPGALQSVSVSFVPVCLHLTHLSSLMSSFFFLCLLLSPTSFLNYPISAVSILHICSSFFLGVQFCSIQKYTLWPTDRTKTSYNLVFVYVLLRK